MVYSSFRKRISDEEHYESLASNDILVSSIDHATGGSGRDIYDKVKGGLYRIRNAIHENIGASGHKHPEAKGAAKEGAIAVTSGFTGCGLAEATRGIAWDPNPGITGSHSMNYGWPLPVERIVESVNQSGTKTYHYYFPQSLLANAAIYTAIAFVGLNAAVIGLHKAREWKTNRELRKLNQEISEKA